MRHDKFSHPPRRRPHAVIRGYGQPYAVPRFDVVSIHGSWEEAMEHAGRTPIPEGHLGRVLVRAMPLDGTFTQQDMEVARKEERLLERTRASMRHNPALTDARRRVNEAETKTIIWRIVGLVGSAATLTFGTLWAVEIFS